MAKKPERPKFISFKGAFKFPKLSEPDFGTDEYPKPDGEFSLKLVGQADAADVKKMIAELAPLHAAAVEKGKKLFKELPIATRKKLGELKVNPLFTEVYDKETEEPTGEIEFKFAMKHSGEYKKGPKAGKRWTRKPDIFDAKGNKMNPAPQIWGGTIGRVAFEIGTDQDGDPGYFIKGTGAAGLKLGLNAARILDLVSGGSREASDYGFDDEEDGYEYDPESVKSEDDANEKGDNTSKTDASDDNPDF